MQIAILTMGTRGDVQPFAVLGHALKMRGHRVILSTSENFRSLVESYDLDFIAIENDYEKILNSDEGKKLLKANPFAIKKNLRIYIYPLVQKSLQQFYEIANESDCIVYHSKTMCDAFADIMPGKMIRAMMVPVIEPTKYFPNPAFSGFPIPKYLNRFSYKLTNLAIKMLNAPISKFRQSNGLPGKTIKINSPVMYAVSSHFLPQPDDYTGKQIFTGFWFNKKTSFISTSLFEFLKDASPPLLITFGSMPFKSKIEIKVLVSHIIKHFGIRIVLIKGWGIHSEDLSESKKDLFIADDAPYDVLMPHVKAVIHHGGAGTTAECLRAGKPMLICPILYPVGDQMFWGKQSKKIGVGVDPLPVSKMTLAKISERIKLLLYDKELYRASANIAEKMKSENGLDEAVNFLETRL